MSVLCVLTRRHDVFITLKFLLSNFGVVTVNKLSLKAKIGLLVVSALIALLTISGLSISDTQNDLREARTETLRSVVDSVHSSLLNLHALEKSGELSRTEAQSRAQQLMAGLRYGGKDRKSEYVYSFTTEGVGVYHVAKDRIGKNMLESIRDPKGNYTWKDILATVNRSPSGGTMYTMTARPGEKEAIPKLQYVKLFEPWGWVIGTGAYVEDIDNLVKQKIIGDLVFNLTAIFLIALLGFFVQRNITNQIGCEPKFAIECMGSVAKGDLSIKIPPSPHGSMLSSFSEMVASLRTIIQSIETDAARLQQDAEQISATTADVSVSAQRQSDAASAMAAAVEEMTVSINLIADNATETQGYSKQSVALSEEGCAKSLAASEEMKQIAVSIANASSQMTKLEDRTKQISTIAAVIKDIAGQTNLLALNAAIEAARAGDLGRGFAVVADEVRKLAERTSLATGEIEQMVGDIQIDAASAAEAMNSSLPEIDSGVKASEGAADTLLQIKTGADTTMAHIHDVANATKEQSKASNDIAMQVEEVATMVEQTTAAIKTTAEIAKDIDQLSRHMSSSIQRFVL